MIRPATPADAPAIAAIWPTIKGECIVLDVGATIGADARQLVDLAIMGSAMAQIMYFWRWPETGAGSHSYTHPAYGVQTANFGATTYDWDGMQDATGTPAAAPRRLLLAALPAALPAADRLRRSWLDEAPAAPAAPAGPATPSLCHAS